MIIITLEKGKPARVYEGQYITRNPDTGKAGMTGLPIETAKGLREWAEGADMKTVLLATILDQLDTAQQTIRFKNRHIALLRSQIANLQQKVQE